MLAKLKYLKEEEKALKDIEKMIKEQATRLKQEEIYLNSLQRNSSENDNPISLSVSQAKKDLFDVDNAVNKVPLDDLHSASHQQLHPDDTEDAEEDDEEEEMDSGDGQGSQEDKINEDLMALMRQMQGEEYYEDDS